MPDEVAFSRIEVKRGRDGRIVREWLNIDPDGDGFRPTELNSEKRPRRAGDLPRMFIIGPQRAEPGSADINDELELRFTDAREILRPRGYEGIFFRAAPYRPRRDLEPGRFGITILPGGEGDVPPPHWKREVRDRMKYCEGVALLGGTGSSSAVQWERHLAHELGKPVRSLTYWLSHPPGGPDA